VGRPRYWCFWGKISKAGPRKTGFSAKHQYFSRPTDRLSVGAAGEPHTWRILFSESTSAKWIFNVEVEKLRAEVLFTCREDQNHASRGGKAAKNALFETYIL
jgi:hypothetical protein